MSDGPNAAMEHADTRSDAIEPRPLHVAVAERLRDLICRGEFVPGERLNERVLTERFNVSRTPVREAVKILHEDGFVRLLPNRGAVVVGMTRRDARDLFELMSALEALAGELACKRATDRDIEHIAELHRRMREHYQRRDLSGYFALNQQIHQSIVECTRNAKLADAYRRTSMHIRRARYISNFATERWHRAMEEHERILAALSARDGEELKNLLWAHLENKFRVLEAWLAESEETEDVQAPQPARAASAARRMRASEDADGSAAVAHGRTGRT